MVISGTLAGSPEHPSATLRSEALQLGASFLYPANGLPHEASSFLIHTLIIPRGQAGRKGFCSKTTYFN